MRILEARSTDPVPVREAKKIDFSLYEHDSKINAVRVLLETRGKCRKWYSEKILRAAPLPLTKKGYRFGSDLFPDAVFVNSKGERIALELEVSRKGPSKIREKLRLYGRLLDGDVLDKVWIVATKASIRRAYRKAVFTDSYSIIGGGRNRSGEAARFRIDDYDGVIKPDIGEK